jgi:response regulator RpfG family c-di-GMP phosphodiesterase
MMLHARHYLFTLCLLACAPATAEIYKCRDSQGAVHYTDKPCAGESTVFTPRAAPKADADSEQRKDKTRRLLRAYREEQAEAEQAAARQQLEQQQREQKCAKARNRLDQFLRASRLYRLDKDGKQVNLSAEERAQSLDNARTDVKLWCD